MIDQELASCQTTEPDNFVVLLHHAALAQLGTIGLNERRHRLLRRVANEVARAVGHPVATAASALPSPYQAVVLAQLQQPGHELVALRQDMAEMRASQHDLRRLVNLLRRVQARWPRWLGGAR